MKKSKCCCSMALLIKVRIKTLDLLVHCVI